MALGNGQATAAATEEVLEILIALLAFITVALILQVLEHAVEESTTDTGLDNDVSDLSLCYARISDDDTYERLAYDSAGPAHVRRRRREPGGLQAQRWTLPAGSWRC